MCGWGGAGAFSDGKLTLTTEFGGNLDDYMSPRDLMEKSSMSMMYIVALVAQIARSMAMNILKNPGY